MNMTKMIKVAGIGAAVLALSAGSVFAATATASVNVRTGPGTQFRAVDTLRPGEQVSIVDQNGGWCAIEASGPNGWVSCRYLTSGNDRPTVRTSRPSVTVQLGFGNAPKQRYHRDRNWDRDNWDRDNGHWYGPRSSNMFNSNGFFGLSIGN